MSSPNIAPLHVIGSINDAFVIAPVARSRRSPRPAVSHRHAASSSPRRWGILRARKHLARSGGEVEAHTRVRPCSCHAERLTPTGIQAPTGSGICWSWPPTSIAWFRKSIVWMSAHPPHWRAVSG